MTSASTSRAIGILERLVGFDTTSANSNLPLIEFVEELLRDHGIEWQRIESDDGLKTSIFATIGPRDKSGVGLSGHTDVVPVAGQNWTTDPFVLTRRESRLYGRGTCDMKGFLACVLASIPSFQSRTLTTPVHLLFSYDEEVGCTGVRPMIEKLGRELVAPRMTIVGEPTSMRVVDAHKGAARFETRVTGREAHSSMSHLGVNAIQHAARLVARLREIEREVAESHYSDRFTPPMSTLHVGLIEGGSAMNIVPKSCRFSWEVRPVPGVKTRDVLERFQAFVAEEIIPEMHAVDTAAGVETEVTNDIPAFDGNDAEQSAIPLALQLAGQNETFAVSYMTEAALFQDAGFASVVCGPGDIAQAHAPDEFIEIAELEAAMNFLSRLAQWAEQ